MTSQHLSMPVLESLGVERRPLSLWPASNRGWFGGMSVVAWDPVEVRNGLGLAEAAAQLEAAHSADSRHLVAALIGYDGAATVATYAGWLGGSPCGGDAIVWRAFGEPPADVEDVLNELRAGVQGCALSEIAVAASAPLLSDTTWDLSGRDFRAAVDEVRGRIAAGDVYVLNLTARLTGAPVASPAETLSALVDRADADMSAYFEGWPGATPWIASVSPERFVRISYGELDARLVEIQPIKGTRPRGATPEADAVLAAELAADPKERAEHVMVVDLERNDLGVAATPGTVHVDPLYEVVTTPYCHQLVSTVRGTMRSSATFADLLAATFPCGSVTGAPKRAAIRIAEELERTPRRAYCGSLVVAMPGELDSSVLIRTLEGIAENPDRAQWGAGCGITHDSDPVSEHLEALLKASPVLGDEGPPVALRETMRAAFGRVPLLERHLARLACGGAGPSVLAQVREGVAEKARSLDAAEEYARIAVTVTPDGCVAVGVSAERSSLEVPGGPRIVPVPISELPALPAAAAKPAVRRYWDRAHHAAQLAGGDQAILHTADDILVDGSTANVWLVTSEGLVTPPAPPAVAGVCRELVFDIARELGVPAREAALTLADLDRADEVFLSNAVGLVVPAAGRGGAVTERVRAEVMRHFAAER